MGPSRHGVKVSAQGSAVRVQVQTDPLFAEVVRRAKVKDVLGRPMPVPHGEDVLLGKVWAVSDTERRRTKRQRNLADDARILKAYPGLAARVPRAVLDELL